LKNLILKIIPKSFSKRIALLIIFLALTMMILNNIVIFFYEYSQSFKNAEYNVESQFIIMSKDVSEAIITDDIYTLYSMIEEVSKNIDHIDNIVVFDSDKKYIADAKVRRKIPDNSRKLIVISKGLYAGSRYVGEMAFYINTTSILSKVTKHVGYLALFNLVILFLGTIAGIYVSNKLISPLTNLSSQISKLKVLELPYKFDIPSHSSYETSQLKEVIEVLSSRLKDSIEKITQQEKEMARSERLAYLGTMSAGLAHELKNPIMSISLILDSLAKEKTGDTQFEQDYKIIKNQADKLVYRINEFLKYSRPVEVNKKEINIYDIIQSIKTQSNSEIHEELCIIFNECENHRISIDVDKIVQISQILLHNSADAGADKININIEVENNKFQMSYKDNGKGFGDIDITKIMLPFYTTKKNGVGLGLAICSTIIEAMAGDIYADSNHEDGAAFIISIPV